jgi:cell division transport system permease protein
MTVLIGMFLLGLFIALGTWVLSWSNHVKKELQVQIYFDSTATRAQEAYVGAQLRKDHQRVKLVTFVSKQQAEKQMRKRFPDLYATPLPGNPLPDAWVVTPTKGEYTPILGAEIRRAQYPGVEQPGKQGVQWGAQTAKRVLTIAEVIWVAFLVAVVLLVTASTLLIANTIRLSIFARRREIEVMKLVGATNWFVRGPFMLEGLICGLGGSLFAVILLVIGKEVALPSILPHIGGGSDVHALPFALNAFALLATGLLLGAAGSGLTLRRFLQV